MALQIKDATMLRQIEQLHQMTGMTKTDVLRTALKNELERQRSKTPVKELLAPVLAKVEAMGPFRPTTPEEDKRISDELWED